MMSPEQAAGGALRRFWPWLVLALTVIPAVWHVVDFDEDIDPEFPTVIRPHVQPGSTGGIPAGRARRHSRPHHDLLFGRRRGAFRRGHGARAWRRALACGVLLERGRSLVQRDARAGIRRMVWPGMANHRQSRCARSVFGRRCCAAIAICGVVVANLYVRRNQLREYAARALNGLAQYRDAKTVSEATSMRPGGGLALPDRENPFSAKHSGPVRGRADPGPFAAS